MRVEPLFANPAFSLQQYVCTAGPLDAPFAETHAAHTLSFVAAGTFMYRGSHGTRALVPGAVMAGRAGAEYTCSHEHSRGDVCVSLHLTDETVDALSLPDALWHTAGAPPAPQVMAMAERLSLAARAPDLVCREEAVAGFARAASRAAGATERRDTPTPADRRRALDVALWIDAHADAPASLASLAALAGLSRFHFLRVFAAVTGVTPHQYVLRCRLRRAARALVSSGAPVTEIAFASGFGDLSQFMRAFRHATGLTPARFRAGAGQREPAGNGSDACPK